MEYGLISTYLRTYKYAMMMMIKITRRLVFEMYYAILSRCIQCVLDSQV